MSLRCFSLGIWPLGDKADLNRIFAHSQHSGASCLFIIQANRVPYPHIVQKPVCNIITGNHFAKIFLISLCFGGRQIKKGVGRESYPEWDSLECDRIFVFFNPIPEFGCCVAEIWMIFQEGFPISPKGSATSFTDFQLIRDLRKGISLVIHNQGYDAFLILYRTLPGSDAFHERYCFFLHRLPVSGVPLR